MDYRYTKDQVARGVLPDAQDSRRVCLVKKVTTLRPTYEVRLLTFLASEAGRKLVILVPRQFNPHPAFSRLAADFPKVIQVEKTL